MAEKPQPGEKAEAENRRRERARALVSAARHERAQDVRAQPVRSRRKREEAPRKAPLESQFHASPQVTGRGQRQNALRSKRSQLPSESSELLLVLSSRQSKALPQRSTQRKSSFRNTPELPGDCMIPCNRLRRFQLIRMTLITRVSEMLAMTRRRRARQLSWADRR